MGKKKSFEKGWGQVPIAKEKEVKNELKEAINITSDVQLWRRKRGEVEPKHSEAIAIERVFSKYGIKKIWD